MRIAGNTFLVTGGSSGLGAACARRLVESGGRVVIADVNAGAGQALAAALGKAAAAFAETDVTQAASVEQALAVARDQFGGLQGAINCAGILGASRMLTRSGPHDLDLFARVVQVNLIGTFNVSRLAAHMMAAGEPQDDGERGVIINTSSVAAFEGQIGQAAYSASKGGVASMTLPLARDLARHGIRIVAIAPGIFLTPMIKSVPDKVRQGLEAQAVFPSRLGDPAEYAALAQHIIENPMLNGSVIRLDGAVRMPPV